MKPLVARLLVEPILALFACGLALNAQAADHLDPPARTDPGNTPPGTDRNADIADLFVWHQGTGANASLVAVVTFAGPTPPTAGQAVPCDRDVLYGIHISNDADQDPEFSIYARFGEDDLGNCFVSFDGIPGTTRPVIAPLERVVTRSGVKVFAGLRDDPFFFDLQGFQETLSMGTIRMINDRDFFSGLNSAALVVEFPLVAISPGGEVINSWSTTARF